MSHSARYAAQAPPLLLSRFTSNASYPALATCALSAPSPFDHHFHLLLAVCANFFFLTNSDLYGASHASSQPHCRAHALPPPPAPAPPFPLPVHADPSTFNRSDFTLSVFVPPSWNFKDNACHTSWPRYHPNVIVSKPGFEHCLFMLTLCLSLPRHSLLASGI